MLQLRSRKLLRLVFDLAEKYLIVDFWLIGLNFIDHVQITHFLGGENFVFWGGREGYQTLLNTDMKKELDHMVRSNINI